MEGKSGGCRGGAVHGSHGGGRGWWEVGGEADRWAPVVSERERKRVAGLQRRLGQAAPRRGYGLREKEKKKGREGGGLKKKVQVLGGEKRELERGSRWFYRLELLILKTHNHQNQCKSK
jgi:hypothetical protein